MTRPHNIRRGLFRIWLLFTLVWSSYWVFAYFSASESLKSNNYYSAENYRRIKQLEKDKTAVPIFAENGLSKGYYQSRIDEGYIQAREIGVYSGHLEEQIDASILYGPGVPIGLVIVYVIYLWIRKGFDVDKQ